MKASKPICEGNQIIGVSDELIRRSMEHDNITHKETVTFGKVMSFLELLYMVSVVYWYMSELKRVMLLWM